MLLIYLKLFWCELFVFQGSFLISPPWAATLSWWRGLRALVIPGAMVSGPVYPWRGLPWQPGPRWRARLSAVQEDLPTWRRDPATSRHRLRWERHVFPQHGGVCLVWSPLVGPGQLAMFSGSPVQVNRWLERKTGQLSTAEPLTVAKGNQMKWCDLLVADEGMLFYTVLEGGV